MSMHHAIKDISAEDMTISRVIGHKLEMPGLGQWKILSDDARSQCWCCNFSQFALIVWNPLIGEIVTKTTFQITSESKEEVSKELIKNYQNIVDERPILFSQSNGWRGEAMIPILEFSEMLGEPKIDIKQMHADRVEEQEPNYNQMGA